MADCAATQECALRSHFQSAVQPVAAPDPNVEWSHDALCLAYHEASGQLLGTCASSGSSDNRISQSLAEGQEHLRCCTVHRSKGAIRHWCLPHFVPGSIVEVPKGTSRMRPALVVRWIGGKPPTMLIHMQKAALSYSVSKALRFFNWNVRRLRRPEKDSPPLCTCAHLTNGQPCPATSGLRSVNRRKLPELNPSQHHCLPA